MPDIDVLGSFSSYKPLGGEFSGAGGPANEAHRPLEATSDVGAAIRSLEVQKQAAVAVEDYDEAKRLKLRIEELRLRGGAAGFVKMRPPPPPPLPSVLATMLTPPWKSSTTKYQVPHAHRARTLWTTGDQRCPSRSRVQQRASPRSSSVPPIPYARSDFV